LETWTALAFPFDGGRLCLDFAGTRGDRAHRRIERLREPVDLGCWIVEAGLAERPPSTTPSALRQAHQLREAIYRALHAGMTHEEMNVSDVAVINEAANRPPLAPELEPGGRGIRWAPGPSSAALAVVARDAVDLLASEKLARVRECAAANCSLLFLDESRAGRRRWCAMTRCGNRAKAAAAYRRRRGS
jgi:predicted RNA-binding Zn ribbon-like protein